MQTNVLISLLVHKGILAEEEAKAIVKELTQTIVPTEFAAAHRIVKGVLEQVTVKGDEARSFIVSEEEQLKAKKSIKK